MVCKGQWYTVGNGMQWAMVCNGQWHAMAIMMVVMGDGNGDVVTSSKRNNRETGQSVPAAEKTTRRQFKALDQGQHD